MKNIPIRRAMLRPRIPDHLTEILIENATDSGRDIRRGRAQRADGLTPDRIRTFLQALARRGIVAEAARAAGISAKSAYALRNCAKGLAFARAWQAAAAYARRLPEGRLISRPTDHCIVPIIRRGRLWGELHRPDNRRTMATLRRLDRAVAGSPQQEEEARLAAGHWDEFIEFVANGGESVDDFRNEAECDEW